MKMLVSLTLVFLFLQAKLWGGNSGIFSLRATHLYILEQEQKSARLSEQNRHLAAEVQLLKTEHELSNLNTRSEDYARWKLGMIKPKEIFYDW